MRPLRVHGRQDQPQGLVLEDRRLRRATLTLYRARFSTNVERVALTLALKGLEAESVWITYEDRSAVEQVSGQGLVPVLDYDGEILVESMDIVRELTARHPEPPLYAERPSDVL